MQRIRDRQHFYDEIKWNKVSAKKLPLMIDLLNVFFSSDATFTAFVANKSQHDVIGRFGSQFRAYEALARQLVKASVRRGETLWVIADEYSTPPGETFEENVRDYVNAKLRRPAVAASAGCAPPASTFFSSSICSSERSSTSTRHPLA